MRVRALKLHDEQVLPIDGLKRRSARSPRIVLIARHATTGNGTGETTGLDIGVADDEAALIVGWVIEQVIHMDGVILAGADVQGSCYGQTASSRRRARVDADVPCCGATGTVPV